VQDPEQDPARRAGAAPRAHLSAWFLSAFWVAWTGTLLGPVLMLHHERFGVPPLPYVQVFVLLLMVVLVNFRQRSGVDLSAHGPVHAALRRHAGATAAVIGVGAVVTWVPALLGLPVPALAAGLVAGALTTARVRRIGLGVRDDVFQDR
jgi:hypothetical protein